MTTTPPPPHEFPDWHVLYQQQPGDSLPWYFPELDPDLAAALERHGLDRGRILDIGTGPGTQAIELAARGFDATGTDLSAAAVAGARERAAARGLAVTFLVDDVLRTRLTDIFDAAFDRGCFHVLAPADRPTYVATVADRLAPAGLLFLKCFSSQQPGDYGPYRFTRDQIADTFAARFDLLSADETVYQGTLETLPRALFSVLRRR